MVAQQRRFVSGYLAFSAALVLRRRCPIRWAYRTRFESPTVPDEIDPNDPFAPSPRRRNFVNEDGTDAALAPDGELTAVADIGESEFVGSKSLSGGAAHNFGILIHNLWDETVRNLWDSSIIYGTVPQSTTIRSVFGERAGNHEAPQLGVDPPSRHPGPRPQDSA